MSNWDKYTYARDLSDFISLIQSHEIPVETTQLAKLDSQFQYSTEGFLVAIENVLFSIDKKISGTIPPEIDHIEILLTHKCEIDLEADDNENDPITAYDFQLHIRGYDEKANEYINWWHLDKNIESVSPKFTHPYYHFQAGGNAIESVDSGQLILLGAPRLPHPPMDLFLGFHFIINNFFSSKDYEFVNVLLEDVTYQGIIQRAQQRMWDKYFQAYNGGTHNQFNLRNIFPLYIANE